MRSGILVCKVNCNYKIGCVFVCVFVCVMNVPRSSVNKAWNVKNCFVPTRYI